MAESPEIVAGSFRRIRRKGRAKQATIGYHHARFVHDMDI
jgi:hypothetical protein